MIGLSFWTRHQVLESMSKTIEFFYDTPMIAMPVMSAQTVTMMSSRINFLIGVGLVMFGALRLFVPDFKTVVLLEIADKLGIGQLPGEDEHSDLKD